MLRENKNNNQQLRALLFTAVQAAPRYSGSLFRKPGENESGPMLVTTHLTFVVPYCTNCVYREVWSLVLRVFRRWGGHN